MIPYRWIHLLKICSWAFLLAGVVERNWKYTRENWHAVNELASQESNQGLAARGINTHVVSTPAALLLGRTPNYYCSAFRDFICIFFHNTNYLIIISWLDSRLNIGVIYILFMYCLLNLFVNERSYRSLCRGQQVKRGERRKTEYHHFS